MVRVDDLRAGSVVRLASGSPKMVVTGVQPTGQGRDRQHLVHVTWWSERQGLLKNAFAPEILVYPRPTEPPASASADEAAPDAEVCE